MERSHALDNESCARRASVFDPKRWGIPIEAVADLGNQLHQIWQEYHDCFVTKRHDTCQYALVYLKGLMLLPCKRNYKNIARAVESPDSDGQNLQQFMSDSPWPSHAVHSRIQSEIRQEPCLHNGMLTLDESGDVRSGDKSAGAARQYIGSVGKVAMGQVGVTLGYYADNQWAMVDAELFLPECWFDEAHKQLRRQLHIPEDRQHQTKLEIGLQLIDRARHSGLPFSRFSCDALYGQSHDFRAEVNQRGIPYMADIPRVLKVYLEKPIVGVPPKGPRGRSPKRWKVLNGIEPIEVQSIAQMPTTKFRTIDIRSCERGRLRYACTKRTVWTISSDGDIRQEILFIRRESDGDITYSLSNEPESTPLKILAQWRSERYFAERIYQDAKSEGGWDELIARKYRAWMHHTALDALALWFVARMKLRWKHQHPPDSKLVDELQLDQLPALSMANIRVMLQAVMPLPQLTVEQAVRLVVKHLVNRSASTRSRLKSQRARRNKQKTRAPT